MKLVKNCQFHQHFMSAKVSREAFLYRYFRFTLYWCKNIGAKSAHTMLVKLTSGFSSCRLLAFTSSLIRDFWMNLELIIFLCHTVLIICGFKKRVTLTERFYCEIQGLPEDVCLGTSLFTTRHEGQLLSSSYLACFSLTKNTASRMRESDLNKLMVAWF